MQKEFYSNGKLLLTGEYAVLDGALSLAVPTKFGQRLTVFEGENNILSWKSFDADTSLWFNAEISLPQLEILSTNAEDIANTLIGLLKESKKLNPHFLVDDKGFSIETHLTFSRNWGLGTSSTLVNNLAQWAKVDPYKLLNASFGGSAYDIACAQHDQPILYQLNDGKPKVERVEFNPPFKYSLYFVYLNRKQNSREAIAQYRKKQFDLNQFLSEINSFTKEALATNDLSDFERILKEHEALLSEVLKTPSVQHQFPDYFGQLKSLGAWGGDFILTTGNEKTPDYFKAKGFETVIPYRDMVL